MWALAYRITGVAADADEIVQESYVRALEHPAKGDERSWLVKIAANLARDRLRARRYKGPFVPSPIEEDIPSPEQPPDARYDLKESASMAFLVACEALSAKARAVLILRDVLDCSVEETARLFDMTETNVKVTHHRARRILEGRPRHRAPNDAIKDAMERFMMAVFVAWADAHRPSNIKDAMERFMMAVALGDVAQVAALLSDDSIALQDGGGQYIAAGIELHGPEQIARAMVGIGKHTAPMVRGEMRLLNGQPTWVVECVPDRPRLAPRWALTLDLGPDGKIVRIYTVLADRKLTAVR